MLLQRVKRDSATIVTFVFNQHNATCNRRWSVSDASENKTCSTCIMINDSWGTRWTVAAQCFEFFSWKGIPKNSALFKIKIMSFCLTMHMVMFHKNVYNVGALLLGVHLYKTIKKISILRFLYVYMRHYINKSNWDGDTLRRKFFNVSPNRTFTVYHLHTRVEYNFLNFVLNVTCKILGKKNAHANPLL